ncbi:MAG: aldolase, partial [Actinobacteria bacterium]|nr:aldolase [Actinomycetota bacterium]
TITPIVRVPANLPYLVGQQLDLGARGVMVPMVETAEMAQTLSASAHYPPEGRRGAAFGIAHDDYAGGDISKKVASANENVLTIAQIETSGGVENAEAIAAVDGIDVLFLGHFDLTSFLGIPGSFEDDRFTDSVDRIVAAATEHDKVLACLALTVDEAKRWIDRGFRMITFGGDLWVYQRALADGIRAIKS